LGILEVNYLLIKLNLLLFFLLIISPYVFSAGGGERGDDYMIVNNSDENIIITFKINEILKQGQNRFLYENDFHYISGIHFDIINEIIPYRNSYFGGVRNLKYRVLIRRYLIIDYKYTNLSGVDLFDYIVDEFIVYDMFGNIIMTLDDITEDHFREDYIDPYIEEYDDDFLNTFLFYYQNENETRTMSYGIFITQNIINAGRIKYKN
jgi:hypothetical protein